MNKQEKKRKRKQANTSKLLPKIESSYDGKKNVKSRRWRIMKKKTIIRS